MKKSILFISLIPSLLFAAAGDIRMSYDPGTGIYTNITLTATTGLINKTNGVPTVISSGSFATAVQGATADAALPATSGTASNLTATGTLSTPNGVYIQKASGVQIGPYSTIKSAYAAAKATSPTSSAPCAIVVGSGLFIEAPISMDTAYISIEGSGPDSTIVSFGTTGFVATAGNWDVGSLRIVANGTNTGPLLSSASRISGTLAGGQYKAGTSLNNVTIENNVSSGTALGGFFGKANGCVFTATAGVAVDVLWGGQITGSVITGFTYGVNYEIAYWPAADPFGTQTAGPIAGSSSNINAGIYSSRIQATATNGIAVHGLAESGVDWIANVSGESITNAALPVAMPPIVAGCYIYGPQFNGSTGAGATGTLTILGCNILGTTCIRDLHDCYVTGNYINQYPFPGYVIQRVWSVGFISNSIVADASVQTYRWLAANTTFGGGYFEGNARLQFTSTWSGYIKGGNTDTNGTVGAQDGSATAPTYAFMFSGSTGMYRDTGLNPAFTREGVGRMWIGASAFYFGNSVAAPNFSFNEAAGGPASGYWALLFRPSSPWTIGNSTTGGRTLSGLADGTRVTVDVGNMALGTVGRTYQVKEGSGGKMGLVGFTSGTANLTTGTGTVFTGSSRFFAGAVVTGSSTAIPVQYTTNVTSGTTITVTALNSLGLTETGYSGTTTFLIIDAAP